MRQVIPVAEGKDQEIDPVLLPVAAALPVSLAVFVPEQASFPFPRIGALQRSEPRVGQGFFPLPNTAVFTEPW